MTEDSSKTPPLSEKALFLAADEIEDPATREAFLREQCQGDESLFARLQTLFEKASEDDEEDLLDVNRYEDLEGIHDDVGHFLSSDGELDLGSSIQEIGDYTLKEELGRGAMGVVYRATQRSLNREVALKVILGQSLSSEADRQRFRLEAEAAAHLSHPNIVPVHEIGSHEGHDFFSMLLVTGGTLTKRMSELDKRPRDAVKLMLKVIEAVQAAHERGIIHRDLKPDNILLDDSGGPLVSDFGLASRLEQGTGLTMTGQIMGTPKYMAPEQAEGDGRMITTAADIHSLGAILYELLGGQPAFKSDSILETLRMVKEENPKPLRVLRPGISHDLETIVLKCLEKDPARRYRSVRALGDDLLAWLESRPISARPPSRPERLAMWVKRRPAHAALLGTATLLLLVLGVGGPLAAIQQASLRKEADESAERNREMLYVANMNQLVSATSQGELLANYREFIDPWRPIRGSNQKDLREWEWYYLNAFFNQAEQTIQTGQGRVQTVALNAQGDTVAVGFFERPDVLLYSEKDGRQIASLSGHQGGMLQIEWEPSGKRLASVSSDGTLIIWDGEHARLEHRCPSGIPHALTWSPNGSRIAVLDANQTVRVWNANSGEPLEQIPIPRLTQYRGKTNVFGISGRISWSPDGNHLAVSMGPATSIPSRKPCETIVLLNINEPSAEPRILSGSAHYPTDIAWKSDSSAVVSVGHDRHVAVWDPGGASPSVFSHGAAPIRAMALDPNGPMIVMGSDNRAVHLVDLSTQRLAETYPGQEHPITSLDWSRNGRRIAVGDSGGVVRIWKAGALPVRNAPFRAKSGMYGLRWRPDGQRITTTNANGRSHTFSADGTKTKHLDHLWMAHHSFGWNAKSSIFAIVKDRDAIRLVDEESGSLSGNIQIPGHTIMGLHWHPSLNHLATCVMSNATQRARIVIWDADTRTELKQLWAGEPREAPWQLSWAPDGKHLLATGWRSSILVLAVDSGQQVELGESDPNAANRDRILWSAWHPDGNRFATASTNGELSIWDYSLRQKVGNLIGHTSDVLGVAWHPSGARLGSCSADGTIRVWDPVSLRQTLVLRGHESAVHMLAWSPDGKVLASTGNDGRFRLWDASLGYEASDSQ